MSAPFRAGDHVRIRARVQQVYRADAEPAYQTYSLILPDGQNLQTNAKNLEPLEEDAEGEGQPAKAKALTRPPQNKAMAGPRETKGAEVLPPPDQTRDPAPDAPRQGAKTDG